jgi:NitT/TauT family transport system substrate-binding protein
MKRLLVLGSLFCGSLFAAVGHSAPSFADDKVTVGYGTGTTALPYFVGVEMGLFKKHGIDINGISIPLNSNLQSSLIANQVDAGAVMLAVEGMAANYVKPGSITYISLNAQSDDHRMEQFVARKGEEIKSLADFKGKKLVSAPGIGNMTIAKAALQAAGLKDGDYKLDQLDTAQHINVLTSGQYDGAYTLEPNATIMRAKNVAYTVEAGLVAKIVLGNPKANAYMAGGALSQKFLTERPDVAKRYIEAWDEAIDLIAQKPAEARQTLLKYTPTAPEIVNDVPLVLFSKLSDVSQADIDNFQKYIDFSVKIGVIPGAVDVRRYIAKF